MNPPTPCSLRRVDDCAIGSSISHVAMEQRQLQELVEAASIPQVGIYKICRLFCVCGAGLFHSLDVSFHFLPCLSYHIHRSMYNTSLLVNGNKL
jgi:hypothetical protein